MSMVCVKNDTKSPLLQSMEWLNCIWVRPSPDYITISGRVWKKVCYYIIWTVHRYNTTESIQFCIATIGPVTNIPNVIFFFRLDSVQHEHQEILTELGKGMIAPFRFIFSMRVTILLVRDLKITAYFALRSCFTI